MLWMVKRRVLQTMFPPVVIWRAGSLRGPGPVYTARNDLEPEHRDVHRRSDIVNMDRVAGEDRREGKARRKYTILLKAHNTLVKASSKCGDNDWTRRKAF